MSRHHMLPPLIYAPPPQVKKVEPKKRRVAVGLLDEIDEAEETSDTAVTGPATLAAIKPPLAQMPEIESPDSRPRGPAGRLSQDTMTALLRAQELKN